MRTVWFLCFAFLGCGSNKTKGPDCSAAAAALAKIGPLKDDLKAWCVEEKWSQAAIACMSKATSKADVGACAKHFTDDQFRPLSTTNPMVSEQRIAVAEAELTKFTDAMCACKDGACAQRVTDDMGRWTIETASRYGRPPPPTGERAERLAALGDRMQSCLIAAMKPPPNDAQRYVAKNAEFKDRLCACKDAACGETVAAELTKWSEDFVKSAGDGSTMTGSDQTRLQAIETEVHACLKALRERRK
ncbi:MAG TPA: hypothetical protein VIV11_28395 [Kofleriaceae bacterium]